MWSPVCAQQHLDRRVDIGDPALTDARAKLAQGVVVTRLLIPMVLAAA